MDTYTILHNPRCSKSRAALALLREHDIEPTIRLYLEEPLSLAELRDVSQKLALPAIKFIRINESEFAQLDLRKDNDDETLLGAIAAHPRLLERPIVIKNNTKAVLGRPPEHVLTLLEPT